MNEALMVSNIILWVVVLALVVALVALARQVGILYERVAPIGALMMDSGPKVGDEAPAFDLVDLAGQAVSLGKPADRSTLLFFLSPSCPVCKKL
ncbi:MAG: thiol-disulfide isomerase, partial [Rhodocyclales bacterium CG_4_10_14_3_um_filter_68_10]